MEWIERRHRYRDCRQTEKTSFHRGGNRSGIKYVIAHVGAGVDAGDDHVGVFIEQTGNGQMDAVGRCAVDEIKTILGHVHAHRSLQGQ